ASPYAHRVLVELPEPRSRLAGVPHRAPAGGHVHAFGGIGGDPGQVLKKVERRALRSEDGGGPTSNPGHRIPAPQPFAFPRDSLESESRIGETKHQLRDGKTGKEKLFLRPNRSHSARPAREDSSGRGVAPTPILPQSLPNQT